MKDNIIELLSKKNKALDIDEIFHLLELTRADYDKLVNTINEMVANYEIYETNRDEEQSDEGEKEEND